MSGPPDTWPETWFDPSSSQTVVVPEPFREIFAEAQRNVRRYFTSFNADPATGRIEIGDDRYVLVRASALSIDFLDTVTQLYGDRPSNESQAIGRAFLFDIAHTIGKNDARSFHKKMGLTDPLARLATGPVHFAYSGWALVEIKECSEPAPNEDFTLVYDHPYSFEADSWLRSGRTSMAPVCIMSAGYSSGWAEESYGIPVTAVEVTCRARGEKSCSFVMAHPDHISERLLDVYPDTTQPLTIPKYFGRKQEEDALRSSEERLGSILSALPLPVLIAGEDSTLLYCNSHAQTTFGLEPAGRMRLSGIGLFEDPQTLADVLASAARGEQVLGHEHAMRDASGNSFAALVSCHPLVLPDGESGVVITALDVTEYKQAQAALRVNERMATVGTLAAGVAHEINNPLAYVIANLERVAGLLEADDPTAAERRSMKTSIAHALEGADRVRSIVRDLRALSRDDVDESQATVVAVEEMLDQAIRIASVSWRPRATIVQQYAGASLVRANRGRLSQVFLNLIVNAAQAIPEGAPRKNTITVSTHRDSDAWVEVVIGDSGVGMDPGTSSRMFEPFYTTKVAEGVGLGLAISKRIVDDLGGEISAKSQPGDGTSLRVRLPRAHRVDPPAEPPVTEDVDLRGLRILVVDDEPAITELLGEVLSEMLGESHVEVAGSGRAAQELLESSQFDVVLCDLMMPDVTGIELYQSCAPETRRRILFMTGGAFTPAAQAFLRGVENPCIEKPIDLESLRRAIGKHVARLGAAPTP